MSDKLRNQVYPLVFRREDYIPGTGFISLIRSQGRLLLVQEPEGFWVYGVAPCAISACGTTRAEALLRFQQTYVAIMCDYARAARNGDEFEVEVRKFFYQPADEDSDAWEAARQQVRDGSRALEGMKTANAADYPPSIQVDSIRRPETEARPANGEFYALADAA